ncbi:MAG: c-type cytochrome [Burkholderiales bacterium]|nr:c-type cytochrome [Burkholderiales bacterium]
MLGSPRQTTLFLLCSTLFAAPMLMAQSTEPIKPLPLETKQDPKKVALGARLFGDVRFAKNNDVSCMSCHKIVADGGADSRPRSIGTGGVVGVVNSPSVLNADLNIAHLWSGASPSFEELIGRIIKSNLVFNSNWTDVLVKLRKDDSYRSDFAAIYSEGMTEASVTDALAVFQRSLITPSRFDSYLRGDNNAISADEKKGYEKFKSYGCVACHQGMGVGGNMYQQFGVLGNYFKDRGNISKPDFGRFNVTNDAADKFVFKVPSLRNVEYTAPYFHDGTAKNLHEALDAMFKYQLGRSAPDEDKELIIKFLKTLSADPAQLKRIEAMVKGGK